MFFSFFIIFFFPLLNDLSFEIRLMTRFAHIISNAPTWVQMNCAFGADTQTFYHCLQRFSPETAFL